MVDGIPARLVLEVSSPGPAPTGTLTAPDGTRAPFGGWLQVLAALGEAFDDLGQSRAAA